MRAIARGMLMQPAFFLVFLFPPPAAGPLVLARLNRARAGRAADGRETAIVQRIDGNAMFVGESGNRIARPVEQRIDLENAERGIVLGRWRLRASRRLAG